MGGCNCVEETIFLGRTFEDDVIMLWYEIVRICCQFTGADWICVAMFAIGVVIIPKRRALAPVLFVIALTGCVSLPFGDETPDTRLVDVLDPYYGYTLCIVDPTGAGSICTPVDVTPPGIPQCSFENVFPCWQRTLKGE